MLGDDIRARVRVLVTDLDQNPAPLPGAGQGKAAGELGALQPDRQVTRFVAEDLGRALIPDDHRAAAARLSLVHALEVARLQRVVLDWHGQPAQCRIKGWPLGNGPRAQDLAGLDPEIEMQPCRVMKLHDKTGGGHPATVPPAIRRPQRNRQGLRSWPAGRQTELVTGQAVGQEWDERTYRGMGPHRADPRAASVASQVAALTAAARPGTIAEHVGSTAVPGLIGKNVVDLQIAVDPAEVPAITSALLELGFARQRGREPWPPERPMLEGTFRCRGGVFLLHCHVVPTTDPEVGQMIEFRDLLRRDPAARKAYAADKRRIASLTCDSLGYTHAKTALIRRLLAG